MGFALLATAALALPASASAKSPTTRVTFGIAPASAHGPDDRAYLSYGVTPGARLADHVALLNYSRIALTLQVYAVDATETTSGAFGLLPAGAHSTGVGAWVTVPAGFATVRVPARSSRAPGEVVVPLRVRIPDDATPGDHVGGVVAALRSLGTNASGQSIVLVQRIGVRVFIRVAGNLRGAVAVTGLRATYRGTLDPIGQGSVRVTYVVRNTGNVDLSVAQRLDLSGLLGDHRVLRPGTIRFLLPGAAVDESMSLSGLWPAIHLQAVVTTQPTVLGGAAPRLPSVTAGTSFWALPWPSFVALVLLLAAVVASLKLRARLGGRQRASGPQVARA